MPEMEIPINAEVWSKEGRYGRCIRVVFDPVQRKVTDLVVREYELPAAPRLIPIDLVQATTASHISLAATKEQLRALEPFSGTQFVLADARLHWVMLWPYVELPPGLVVLEHEKLATNEAALRRGVPVYASDGFIGDVRELMVERPSGNVSHLVLREGHLYGKKDVCIPISLIASKSRTEIRLHLSKREVEALPDILIHRPQ